MDYRDIIKAEFLHRRQKDTFYSLRKFAKDLGLQPMHLSYILKYERGLSKEKAKEVAGQLGLKTYSAKKFVFMATATSGRSQSERALAKNALKRKAIAAAKL